MNNKRIIALENFIPEKEEKIILDTNVLINIFTPYNNAYNDKLQKSYGNLWGKLIKKKCSLLVSSVQISEFINRCIRIEFDLYKREIGKNDMNFKREYRSTEDYMEKMKYILDIMQNDILPNFTFISDDFNEMNKDNIFKYGFSYDFNDSLLVEIVKKNNAILITDDADFGNYQMNFTLVTSNNFLLRMKH